MPELTGSEQDTKFKPGQSGNPAGRPKGARSKLGEDFLKALVEDFNEVGDDGKPHGIVAIRKMRTDNPDQYVRVLASILPKELSGEDGGPIEVKVVDFTDAPDDVVRWVASRSADDATHH